MMIMNPYGFGIVWNPEVNDAKYNTHWESWPYHKQSSQLVRIQNTVPGHG